MIISGLFFYPITGKWCLVDSSRTFLFFFVDERMVAWLENRNAEECNVCPLVSTISSGIYVFFRKVPDIEISLSKSF